LNDKRAAYNHIDLISIIVWQASAVISSSYAIFMCEWLLLSIRSIYFVSMLLLCFICLTMLIRSCIY